MDNQFELIHGTTNGNNELTLAAHFVVFHDVTVAPIKNVSDCMFENVW